MPKYIQPILIDGRRYYAVFSTISMDFLTPLYPSVKDLKKAHPEYRRLKVVDKVIRGRFNEDGSIEVYLPVYKIEISREGKRHRKSNLLTYGFTPSISLVPEES